MATSSAHVADLDARFDEHYLHFHLTTLTPERTERDAALVARLLDLAPGMEVLDVPCAYGRIANQWARRGCRVTGLDANPVFLERARLDAAGLGVRVEYVLDDMRQLPWVDRFDRIVNWFVSFGYFDDEVDRQVLAGFRRALRPGGRLIVHTVNLPTYLRSLPAGGGPLTNVVSEVGDDMMIYRRRYNPLTGRDEYERVVVRDGKVSHRRFAIRYFTFVELRDWLVQAGFPRVDAYAGDGGPLTLEAGAMILVAQA